jgi:AmmeMemoRadiSam system protein B
MGAPADAGAAWGDVDGAPDAASIVVTAARRPAVIGRFYPRRRERLWQTVHELLDGAARRAGPDRSDAPKAIIAPHAAYMYSGPVAATAHATLVPARGTVHRVIIAGPAHFRPVHGVAVPSVDAFRTPLGRVAIDDEARQLALQVRGVVVDDDAHAPEHSVEVQLPLLAGALGDPQILPLLVGRPGGDVLAEVLDCLWGGPETSIVISTDLSHYLDAATASRQDRRTAAAICRLAAPGPEAACGAAAVAGMLSAARRRRLDVRLLDLRTSADTHGGPERVVGYGAFAMFPMA